MMDIKRNEWIFGEIQNPINDKPRLLKHEVIKMLNKSTTIFEYEGLPDTIQVKDLETQLQVGGYNIWKEVKGDLYTFNGGLGGEPNPYYLPTIAIVANPALRVDKSFIIDKECVVMLNDHYYEGLMPMFNKNATLLVEAEISLWYAIINARVPALIQADNDNTKASAEEFFKKIVNGDGYGVIASKEFFDGIRSQDFYKQAYIKDIIESIQYIKGSWYNEIGLNAAFNMKREAINEAEATLNEDILYPTIDNMLECREFALDKVNKMYGTNIKVKLNSVWEQNRKHEDLVLEAEEAEIEATKNDGEENENEDIGNSDTDTAD